MKRVNKSAGLQEQDVQQEVPLTMIKHHRGLIQGNRVVDKLTCSDEHRLTIAWKDMKSIRERTTFMALINFAGIPGRKPRRQEFPYSWLIQETSGAPALVKIGFIVSLAGSLPPLTM